MSKSYTVIARRYRPQGFDDVLAQEYITGTLKNAISGSKVAHAYIFSGPRGVGKTSLARIFAKALNCEKGPTPEPCGKCMFCKSIAEGNDPDVIEIDAASQNSIDDVRHLQDVIAYVPLRAKYKIYIMDEAHQLSKPSFNALLKTIEEPPPHIKFIFATTEPNKLPETILSRCQRFNFRPIPSKKIYEHLTDVCKKEKFACDSALLATIAKFARGSMRDAQTFLDLAISSHDSKGNLNDLGLFVDATSSARIITLVDAIINYKLADLVAVINDIFAEGRSVDALLEQLIEHFWYLILIQLSSGKVDLLEEEIIENKEVLRVQSGKFKVNTLIDFITLLQEAKRGIRDTINDRLYFEFSCLKLAKLFREQSGVDTQVNSTPAGARSPIEPKSILDKKKVDKTEKSLPENAAMAEEPVHRNGMAPNDAGNDENPVQELVNVGLSATDEKMKSLWSSVLNLVKSRHPTKIYPYLKEAQLVSIDNEEIIIAFQKIHTFHRSRLEDINNIQEIDKIIEEVSGRPMSLVVANSSNGADINTQPKRIKENKMSVIQSPEIPIAGDSSSAHVQSSSSAVPPDSRASRTEPVSNAPSGNFVAEYEKKKRVKEKIIQDERIIKILQNLDGKVVDVRGG